jgi:hypothetical protein
MSYPSYVPTWLGLWQAPYLERAGDPELPDWVRVEFAMMGHAGGPDGHAPFAPGELAEVLRIVNRETGELAPMSRQNVNRAIRTAKARGAIDSWSTSRCLVVPHARYRSGVQGRGVCAEPSHR